MQSFLSFYVMSFLWYDGVMFQIILQSQPHKNKTVSTHKISLTYLGLILKPMKCKYVMKQRKLALQQQGKNLCFRPCIRVHSGALTACSHQQLKHTHQTTELQPKHTLNQTKQYRYHQLLFVEFRVCSVSKRLMHMWVSFIFWLIVKSLSRTEIHSDKQRLELPRMWRLPCLFRTMPSTVRAY